MKRESMPMFAVNASVSPSLTPTGKGTFNTRLSYNVGTAIDRINECINHMPSRKPSFELISGTQIFRAFVGNNYRYLAFSICGGEGGKQYIITCCLECNGDLVTQERALQLIDKGMAKAFKLAN